MIFVCLNIFDFFNVLTGCPTYFFSINDALNNGSENDLFNACLFLVNKISNFKSFMPQYKAILPSYIYNSLGILAQKFKNFKNFLLKPISFICIII